VWSGVKLPKRRASQLPQVDAVWENPWRAQRCSVVATLKYTIKDNECQTFAFTHGRLRVSWKRKPRSKVSGAPTSIGTNHEPAGGTRRRATLTVIQQQAASLLESDTTMRTRKPRRSAAPMAPLMVIGAEAVSSGRRRVAGRHPVAVAALEEKSE
jgi:hypothetical protein